MSDILESTSNEPTYFVAVPWRRSVPPTHPQVDGLDCGVGNGVVNLSARLSSSLAMSDRGVFVSVKAEPSRTPGFEPGPDKCDVDVAVLLVSGAEGLRMAWTQQHSLDLSC